jgi:hypothetical protein
MKKWFCLMFLIGLSACGSADKVFLGYWKAQGNQFGYLHIAQNGNGHLMTIYDNSLWDGTLQIKEFPVTIKDNSLTMKVPMGEVTGVYKEEDQTFVLNGQRVYQQVSEEEAMKPIVARQQEMAKAEADCKALQQEVDTKKKELTDTKAWNEYVKTVDARMPKRCQLKNADSIW